MATPAYGNQVVASPDVEHAPKVFPADARPPMAMSPQPLTVADEPMAVPYRTPEEMELFDPMLMLLLPTPWFETPPFTIPLLLTITSAAAPPPVSNARQASSTGATRTEDFPRPLACSCATFHDWVESFQTSR